MLKQNTNKKSKHILIGLVLTIALSIVMVGCNGANAAGGNLSHQNGIPAWLIAGLKAYQADSQGNIDVVQWYAEASSRGLPTFGDQWFIPEFIEDPLREDIKAVSFAFVRHLSEIEKLDALIALYHRNLTPWYVAESWSASQARDAERARAKLWAEFVGADVNVQDVIFQYTFGDSQVLTGRGAIGIEFNALAQSGWYFFTASGWPRDVIELYIDAGEESFRFVGDFLGYHPSEPIISVFKAPPYDSGISVYGGGGRYWADTGRFRTIDTMGAVGSPASPIYIHPHEVAHAFLHLAPHISRSNFPSPPAVFMDESWNHDGWLTFGELVFEEGLCVLLSYLFIAYTENEQAAREFSKSSILPTLSRLNYENQDTPLHETFLYIAYNAREGGFETFEEFAAFMEEVMLSDYSEGSESAADNAFNRRATKEEVIKYVNLRAFQILTGQMNTFAWLYDFHGALQADVPYAALYDHYTASSFFFYLLEHRGTKADFLRVYQDIYQMEEVYGIDLESMIAEWRAYLDAQFEEWAQAIAAGNEAAAWGNDFFERYEEWIGQFFFE